MRAALLQSSGTLPQPRRAGQRRGPLPIAACRQTEGASDTSTAAQPAAGLAQRLLSGACAVAAAAALSFAPLDAAVLPAYAQGVTVSNDAPVLDLARVVPAGRVEGLEARMKALERCALLACLFVSTVCFSACIMLTQTLPVAPAPAHHGLCATEAFAGQALYPACLQVV